MDRELLLALLAVLGGGAACCVTSALASAIARAAPSMASGRAFERACWARLWLPVGAAGLVLLALGGWALREPRDAEAVPLWVLFPTACFAFALVRAVARAARGAAARGRAAEAAVFARGFVRPTIHVEGALRQEFDARALEAALAHERAHVAHHDPLRIWAARFAADLQWPLPAAGERLRAWLAALELARDEEAREAGADGADLAAAILHVARGGRPMGAVATLTGGEEALRERIARLLAPLAPDRARGHGRLALAAWTLAGGASVLAGSALGEGLVRALAGLR